MPGTTVQPYLFFGGRCEEAMSFYRDAVGAEVGMKMRFSESPEKPPPGQLKPGFENKIMHAQFQVGESTVMASDGCGEESGFKGFSLAINVATVEQADRAFNALAKGGTVTMPLAKTFWSPRFGMLTDRFGVGWMIGIPGIPS